LGLPKALAPTGFLVLCSGVRLWNVRDDIPDASVAHPWYDSHGYDFRGRRHEPHEARTCTETCLPDSRRGLNNTLSSTGPARFARPYRDGKENYKLFLGWGRSRLL